MDQFGKKVEDLQEEDLQRLIVDKVREANKIEYKRQPPGNSSKDKKKFLANISSFANASGGVVFFGVDEDNGIATEICPVDEAQVDSGILRMEQMIRSSIQPRIMGISFHSINVSGGVVIAVKIPNSWNSPHMITFEDYSRFYSRTSAGKYHLDVAELRNAFLATETQLQRARDFRLARTAKVIAGETPVRMGEGPKLLLHVWPLASSLPSYSVDLHIVNSDKNLLHPIGNGGFSFRYNMDGFLNYLESPDQSGGSIGYTYAQLFRNGAIEAVSSFGNNSLNEERLIPATGLERDLIQALRNYQKTLQALDVELPVFVMLTITGVEGYSLYVSGIFRSPYTENVIDRNELVIPEVLVDDDSKKPWEILQPIFDTLWNSAGWPRSMSYDETGMWFSRS